MVAKANSVDLPQNGARVALRQGRAGSDTGQPCSATWPAPNSACRDRRSSRAGAHALDGGGCAPTSAMSTGAGQGAPVSGHAAACGLVVASIVHTAPCGDRRRSRASSTSTPGACGELGAAAPYSSSSRTCHRTATHAAATARRVRLFGIKRPTWQAGCPPSRGNGERRGCAVGALLLAKWAGRRRIPARSGTALRIRRHGRQRGHAARVAQRGLGYRTGGPSIRPGGARRR